MTNGTPLALKQATAKEQCHKDIRQLHSGSRETKGKIRVTLNTPLPTRRAS